MTANPCLADPNLANPQLAQGIWSGPDLATGSATAPSRPFVLPSESNPARRTSDEIGIPSMGPEDVATRAGRALRVALLHCPGVSGHVDGDSIRLAAADDFALGLAATRAEVALRGEGLATTLTRSDRSQPSAVIGFQ